MKLEAHSHCTNEQLLHTLCSPIFTSFQPPPTLAVDTVLELLHKVDAAITENIFLSFTWHQLLGLSTTGRNKN